MKKSQYLSKLKVRLIKNGLKKSEIDGALQYYGELIDEAVDSGESEEDVIARLPSPQGAADEIKGFNEMPEEPKPDNIKTHINPKSETEYAPKAHAQNNGGNKNVAISVIGLVLFAIFVLPLSIAFVSVVVSLVAAGISVIVSLFAVGIALPIYAAIAAVMSHSLMLLFTYLGAGLICLALGLITARLFKPLLAFVVWLFKWIFKTLVNLSRGTLSYGR